MIIAALYMAWLSDGSVARGSSSYAGTANHGRSRAGQNHEGVDSVQSNASGATGQQWVSITNSRWSRSYGAGRKRGLTAVSSSRRASFTEISS